MFISPECVHKWNDSALIKDKDQLFAKDAYGNLLSDSDMVTLVVVKNLKVKDSASMLKIGTKIKTSGWWQPITTLTAKSKVSAP